MIDTARPEDDLALMLDKVIESDLPADIREQAKNLLLDLPERPAQVEKRIQQLAEQYASKAAYVAPPADLFKCVPVRTVQRHMSSHDWRAIDERAFLHAAERSNDPADFIRQTIPAGTVILPRERSWLIDSAQVAGMTSAELKAGLELRNDTLPPYVLFRFSVAKMTDAGVMVRVPNALDAAAAGQPQWTPGGLKLGQEYLDTAVPIEAVEVALWKP